MTKILGRHTSGPVQKFAARLLTTGKLTPRKTKAFRFTSAFTGNALASYLLGFPQSELTENLIFPATTEWYAGIYFGDTFQATNKLVVNLGVRWEYPGYWTERHNRLGVFLANSPIRSVGRQACHSTVTLYSWILRPTPIAQSRCLNTICSLRV